jgi:hypothetical protein
MARRSKRSLEGYVQVDHRNSPGVRPEDLPAELRFSCVAVPGGVNYESATITCGHCQAGVILNPDRSRERGYCPKCDRYTCDNCELVRRLSGGECRTFERFADDYLNGIAKGRIPWLNASFRPPRQP